MAHIIMHIASVWRIELSKVSISPGEKRNTNNVKYWYSRFMYLFVTQ